MLSPYLERVQIDFSISRNDELASSIVHMVGFGLNLTAMVLLVVFSALQGDSTRIVSFTLFGAFLNLYYIFSVLFHSFQGSATKRVFRILELSGGYLLVAGVAIPLSLVVIDGLIGWTFFGLFIGLCTIGIVNIATNTPGAQTRATILHIFLLITGIIFVILTYSSFSIGLKFWMGIAILAVLVALFVRSLRGIAFRHALSHLCYVIASMALFFGFFIYYI
jgi:hemolysin III